MHPRKIVLSKNFPIHPGLYLIRFRDVTHSKFDDGPPRKTVCKLSILHSVKELCKKFPFTRFPSVVSDIVQLSNPVMNIHNYGT